MTITGLLTLCSGRKPKSPRSCTSVQDKSWGYSGSPAARRKFREKDAEASQNSVKSENREAALVPRWYDTYSERGLRITFKVLLH